MKLLPSVKGVQRRPAILLLLEAVAVEHVKTMRVEVQVEASEAAVVAVEVPAEPAAMALIPALVMPRLLRAVQAVWALTAALVALL